jgi:hypothetical protein
LQGTSEATGNRGKVGGRVDGPKFGRFLEILTFFGHRNIANERVNLISGLKLTYFEKNGQKRYRSVRIEKC